MAVSERSRCSAPTSRRSPKAGSSSPSICKATTLIVAGDADIFPPAHAVELFGLLGGGQRDGGWDGSGRPKSRLAILPGLTHYTIFNAPPLAAVAIPFLDEPAR